MLLAFRLTPNDKGVFEPLTETFVDPRKTFIGSKGYVVRMRRSARGKTERDIERETTMPVWLVAEIVWENVSAMIGKPIPREYVEKLIIYTRDAYSHRPNKKFRKQLKGNFAPDYLRMFMQHWLAAFLAQDKPALFDRLPAMRYFPEGDWMSGVPDVIPPIIRKSRAAPPRPRPSRKRHPKRANAAAL